MYIFPYDCGFLLNLQDYLYHYNYYAKFQRHQFQRYEDAIVEQGVYLMNSGSCESMEDLDDDEQEEGGQGEYKSFVTSLKLFNIQRLLQSKEPKLKFFLTATVRTEGMDKEGKVSYEVPLATHLLNKNNLSP